MAQANALAPSSMTPQQHLAILLQPQSPSEVLLSQSPHQKGVNWVFHNQATGQIRCVNVPYMDITGQQSANPSATQPTMTQQIPNQMSQQAQQMQSAQQPMNHIAQQLAMMTNAASVASPQQTPNVETQVDWSTKIAKVMREQFGLRPKQQSVMYKAPYPPAYNQIPLPHKYKMPDFTKFSGQGEVSTMEHINRFLLQLGEAGNYDALRVRLFSSSLSGSAFAWFTTLPANSILYWADLERQFPQFFYSRINELKLTYLTILRQMNDKSVAAFIQRFKDVKNRCYSLVLSDQQLVEVVFNGLLPHIKDKYASQEFESISQIADRMSGETRSYESKKPFQKKINYVEYSANNDFEEEHKKRSHQLSGYKTARSR